MGNFFGLNDSWAKVKKDMIFLTKDQVLELFKNYFEIMYFNEIEENGKTGLGRIKHWHTYDVIAKKIK